MFVVGQWSISHVHYDSSSGSRLTLLYLCLSICLALRSAISQERLEGISSKLARMSTWMQGWTDLIRGGQRSRLLWPNLHHILANAYLENVLRDFLLDWHKVWAGMRVKCRSTGSQSLDIKRSSSKLRRRTNFKHERFVRIETVPPNMLRQAYSATSSLQSSPQLFSSLCPPAPRREKQMVAWRWWGEQQEDRGPGEKRGSQALGWGEGW